MCWKCVFVKQTPGFSGLHPGCGRPLQVHRDTSLGSLEVCMSRSCHGSPEILQRSLQIPWRSLSRLLFVQLNVSGAVDQGRGGLRTWVMCRASCCRIQVLPEAQGPRGWHGAVCSAPACPTELKREYEAAGDRSGSQALVLSEHLQLLTNLKRIATSPTFQFRPG